jgi:two-component sensor histidine kinase
MIDLTRSKAETIDEFASAVRGRVQAMARVHAMLSQSRWTSLDLREIIEVMRPPESPGHIQLDGPDVSIPVRQATPLGMTVQELMSNSLKHGALSAVGGNVRVRWGTTDGHATRRRLWIDWTESGGPPIDADPEPGLGTSLIEGFCRFELGGEVELGFAPGGVHHVFNLTLDEVDADAGDEAVRGLRQAADATLAPHASLPPEGGFESGRRSV